MSKENKNPRQEETIFQLLMFRYYPYWPLFVGLAILCIAGAWCYLKMTPSLYESTATILIKDEKKGVENSPVIESLNIYTSKKIVENEIEVIKSKTIMRETVEKMHLAAPVFAEGLFTDYDAYTLSPIMVEVKDVNKIKDLKRGNFEFDNKTSLVSYENKVYKLNEWISTQNGELRFVRNRNQIHTGDGPFYFSLVDPRKVTTALQEELKVQAVNKLSTVVNLSIRDVVPVRGEQILNTLLESYNKAAIQDKNSLAANTLEFVQERIRLVEQDLDSVERNIQQYKSSRGVVDLSEQGKLYLKNVGENDQKLSEINMQLAVLDKVEEYLLNEDNRGGIIPSTLGLEDKALSVMIQKLYDAEIYYQRLKKTTAENNPILLSLSNEIQNMRPSLLENIRNQRFSLIARRTNLVSTNDKYASVLQTIPQKERELLEVNRQQSIKSNVYTFLLQKREETALSYASAVGDSRLVDKAESSIKAVAPKKGLVYGGALVLALIAGGLWITIKEYLNNKVLFRSEIETTTKIPIVAEISYSTLKDYVVIDNNNKPFFSEQFRQLRASIGLYGKMTKKVIMITSSISGEGKSFISANLATSLAKSNKKTVLIDLDLRNPRISHYFNSEDIKGVGNCLTGNENPNDAVIPTTTSNLFLLSAGSKIQNPTEILLNADLDQFFAALKREFDFIIVDTAPVDPVTDAYVISTYCDMTLFVMRHNKTPKTMVQLLDENNKIKALKKIMIVFNGVHSRGMITGGFGYGYGFGYENVYSDRQLKS